jgi:copper homeostasis protein
MVLVEICTDNLPDTLEAIRLGADRIELCSQLCLDGLTPALDLFNRVISIEGVRIFPMIRSRPGDFVYSDLEKNIMIGQGCYFAKRGAHGLVFGALCDNGKQIDLEFVKKFHSAVHAINPHIELTFHKAIDVVAVASPCSLIDAVEQLEPYCERVLTSGGASSAAIGANMIKLLAMRGRIPRPLAAGKIRVENVLDLIARTGVEEVHSRCPEICRVLGKDERQV